MRKLWASVVAGVAALSIGAIDQVAEAQDPEVLDRDRKGNVRLHDDAAGFGEEGQWAFSTEAALGIERTTFSDSDASSTTLTILPAADYFIIENLSVGGVVGLTYTKSGDSHVTTFRLGPRVGYNFEISRLLSVWPKLGLSFQHVNPEGSGNNNNAVAINLSAPVMVHPAPHFFVGFGPFVDAALNGDNRATTWGLRLLLGGWL